MIDRDKLNSASLLGTGRAAMNVIEAVQQRRPEEQVVAIAHAFLGICRHHGVAPQDAVLVATNMANHAKKTQRPELEAVHEYIKGELPK